MDHALDFLFTRSSSVPRTERLNSANAAKLREAHTVEYYSECGWHCATGFDSEKRVTVMVHAGSREEIIRAINPDLDQGSAYDRIRNVLRG